MSENVFPFNHYARWTEDEEAWLAQFVSEKISEGWDEDQIFQEASKKLERTVLSVRQHWKSMQRRPRQGQSSSSAEVMPIHIVVDEEAESPTNLESPMNLPEIIRALRKTDEEMRQLQSRNQKLEGMYKDAEQRIKDLMEQLRLAEEALKEQAQRIRELETTREIGEEEVKAHPLYQKLAEEHRALREKYNVLVQAIRTASEEVASEPLILQEEEESGDLVTTA